MANFTIRLSGLIVLSFKGPDQPFGRAMMVRTYGSDHPHVPQLTYPVSGLEDPNESKDDQISYSGAQRMATRALDRDVLTLRILPRGRDPLQIGARISEMAILTQIEYRRLVVPTPGDWEHGIRSNCREPQISADAPIAARLDFEHGTLQARPSFEWYAFKNRKDPFPDHDPPVSKGLAFSPRLEVAEADRLTIVSNRGWERNFVPGRDGVDIDLSNGPSTEISPQGLFIPHFEILYRVARWLEDEIVIPQNVRVPRRIGPIGPLREDGPRTSGDRYCPPSLYGLPVEEDNVAPTQ